MKKVDPGTNDARPKKRTATWLIVAGIILLLLLIWLVSCKVIINKTTSYNYYNAIPFRKDSGLILVNFPDGAARQRLEEGIKSFNTFYGSAFDILEIANEGKITDINSVASDMLGSYFVITGGDETSFSVNEILKSPLPSEAAFSFRNINDIQDTIGILKTLKLNMQEGDYKVNVRILDKMTNKIYSTRNSINREGTRISGIFFLTTIRPDNNITYSIRPNTNCPVKVIATYVFTSLPKITVEVCVRAICDQVHPNQKPKDSIFDCQITEVQPNIGPFCDFKIFPDPERNPNPRGEITKEGCVAKFAWAFVTGFKKIKVSNKATGELEVEGLIGRSTKGSFRVCDRCNSDPQICR